MRISDADTTAQRTFRALLQAMSRPGRVYALRQADTRCDRWGALMTLLESLLDHEVSFTIVGTNGATSLGPLIESRTGSRTAPLEEADFILVVRGDSRGGVLWAKRGTLQYPDQSATVVYQVKSLLFPENAEPRVALTGPGIRREIFLGNIPGLAQREMAQLKEANAEFPLGVDAVFVDETGRVLCIPRSTKIRILEH